MKTLSDKAIDMTTYKNPKWLVYNEKDVKEFIKRLKEGNDMYEIETENGVCGLFDAKKFIEKIDKLAGQALLGDDKQ